MTRQRRWLIAVALAALVLAAGCDSQPAFSPAVPQPVTPGPTPAAWLPTPTATPTPAPARVDSKDKERIMALRRNGGKFDLGASCLVGGVLVGKEESRECARERLRWERLRDAEWVKWERCTFEGVLGVYLSQVEVSLPDDSWHAIYVPEKKVC